MLPSRENKIPTFRENIGVNMTNKDDHYLQLVCNVKSLDVTPTSIYKFINKACSTRQNQLVFLSLCLILLYSSGKFSKSGKREIQMYFRNLYVCSMSIHKSSVLCNRKNRDIRNNIIKMQEKRNLKDIITCMLLE